MSDPAKVEEIFQAALARATSQERLEFLAAACAGDSDLRRQVELLLLAHAHTSSDAERPRSAPAATRAETVGSSVGPYKLLQLLGEGGMGTVWIAEQQQPVKRRVALKLIKPGMDSATIVHRFEAERQALAMMDHPNIARVLDAGTTASGRPYFAMELVPGVQITQYCDELNLSIRERLELCVGVCQAVQHAHQKGVIHRDLKPSNILVCMQDGQPQPKVIDFGVAKALHQRLTEATLYTEFGAVIGTLEYMSPEQAEMSPLGVDTRTDVYALGVLIYELLTGSTPLDRKRLRSASYSDAIRLIKEEEPPRPSTRLTQSQQTLSTLAAKRRCEPARLQRELRGELDWIVMKCLEKDRRRRYESAGALAQDLESYLADRPVLACPPSNTYLARKFVRRHRAAVVAVGLILAALVTGIVGTTWGLIEADQARAEALARAQEAAAAQVIAAAAAAEERKARQAEADQRRLAEEQKQAAEDNARRAVAERQIADAVRTFLQEDLLRQANAITQANAAVHAGRPGEAKADVTVKELLDRAAAELTPARIDRKFPKQREVQASILDTVGNTYAALGEYTKAVDLLTRAHAAYRDLFGAEQRKTMDAQRNLALVYRRVSKEAEAAALLEQVRDFGVKHLGADHTFTADALVYLGGVYRSLGRTTEAIATLEQACDIRARKLGAENGATLNALGVLALMYRDAGKREESAALLERLRSAQERKLGKEHPYTLGTLNNLGLAYTDAGRDREAIALFERVRASRLKAHGPDHPETINTVEGLAEAHEGAGDLRMALGVYREAIAAIEKRDFHYTHTGAVVNRMCGCLEKLQQYDQAESWRRRWLDLARTKEGPQSYACALALTGLGQTLILKQQHADAEPLLHTALNLQRQQQPDAWRTFYTEALLGSALLGQGKHAEAGPPLRAGYEGLKQRDLRIPRAEQARVTDALECLIRLCEAEKRRDEATLWRNELQARQRHK